MCSPLILKNHNSCFNPEINKNASFVFSLLDQRIIKIDTFLFIRRFRRMSLPLILEPRSLRSYLLVANLFFCFAMNFRMIYSLMHSVFLKDKALM